MKRLILALLLLATPAVAQQPLTVLLDWFVNPDHAPLIVADRHGDFRRFGLDVRLVAPADPSDPPKLVAARQGDVAVYYQKSLHLAVDQGLPLVRIGTLVSTPLSTVTVLQGGPIRNLADFKGKRIGYSVAGFEQIVMGAILQGSGVAVSDLRFVAVNFGLSTALMSGQVDAIIGGFRNFELNQLAIAGKPGRAFYPEEHGVPLYDELIYVAHRDRVADPRLRAFIDATEAATAFLINNPDASWQMFLEGRKELDDELNRRAWAATLPRFAHAPAALDRNRYDRFARWLSERGMIRSVPPVESYAVELPPAAR